MRLKWESHGTEAIGNNPPMPVQRCYIGTDSQGRRWLCEAKYITGRKMFAVRFDTDEEIDDENDERYGSPFLRYRVVDQSVASFWEAQRRMYHRTECDYAKIQDHIKNFIEDMKLR